MIEALTAAYKADASERATLLGRLRGLIQEEQSEATLSAALVRFAVRVDADGKSLLDWQIAVTDAFGSSPAFDIGVRMSGVAVAFRASQDEHVFLRLPLEERVLLKSEFHRHKTTREKSQ